MAYYIEIAGVIDQHDGVSGGGGVQCLQCSAQLDVVIRYDGRSEVTTEMWPQI